MNLKTFVRRPVSKTFFRNNIAPWLMMLLAFPALGIVNTVLTPPAPKNHAPGSALFENSHGPLLQAAYLYEYQPPKQMIGQFYYLLGLQYALRGNLLVSEHLLNNAVSVVPEQSLPHLNYGMVLEALDKRPQALAQYQEAITADPKLVDGYYRLGVLYDLMGHVDLGIETLRKALTLEPGNPMINYSIGVLYAKKDDYANSAAYTKAALDLDKDFAEAYNNYGYALAHLNRYPEALQSINKALALAPESAAALDSRGYIFYGMQKYQEAVADYKKAIEIDPTIGEIYLHLGQAWEALNQDHEAAKAYEYYLSIMPNTLNPGERQHLQQKIDSLRENQAQNPMHHAASKSL